MMHKGISFAAITPSDSANSCCSMPWASIEDDNILLCDLNLPQKMYTP